MSTEDKKKPRVREAPAPIAPYVDPRDRHQIVGKMIGPYRVEAVIAEGGQGVLYQAKDVRPSGFGPCALKFLLPFDVQTEAWRKRYPELLKRLEIEAHATMALDHPAIVKVHAFERDDAGNPFIVLERMWGKGLDKYVEDRGPYKAHDLGVFLRKLTIAVSYAHAKRIIHRDLTPANIFMLDYPGLNAEWEFKIIDFGIARLLDRPGVTEAGASAANLDYAAPELCLGEPVDERTDIYFLGAICFYAATGHPPFEQPNIKERIPAIIAGRRSSRIEDHAPDFDPRFVKLIDRMMQASPSLRPRSVAEVRDEVSRLIDPVPRLIRTHVEKPRASRSRSPSQRPCRSRKRRPLARRRFSPSSATQPSTTPRPSRSPSRRARRAKSSPTARQPTSSSSRRRAPCRHI